MHLIHREDRERLGISFNQIESPLFAAFNVRNVFLGSSFSIIKGLDVRTQGRNWTQSEILDAVETGHLLLVSETPFSPLSANSFGKYSHITSKGWSGGFHRPKASESPPLPVSKPMAQSRPSPQEPGFYIVPKSTTLDQLNATLFATQNRAVMGKFQSLNAIHGPIKAGSMIVLSDPNNLQCTREEALLLEAAAQTNDALQDLSAEEADFMERHRAEIESFLALGSTYIGVGEAMFARNLANIKSALEGIEALHQKAFLKDGHLRSTEFFSERKRLLTELNNNLTALTRKSIGLPDHPNLKSALGISSRSLVHQWTKAGAPGQIPGYATHLQGVAKAAKIIKYGGWVGTAIGGGASYMKVQDVCTAGNARACEKVKYTEAASFVGVVAGGAAAGAAVSSAAAGGLCVALGVPTAGIATLACGIVVVGAASYAGGTLGSKMTETTAEKIYEAFR